MVINQEADLDLQQYIKNRVIIDTVTDCWKWVLYTNSFGHGQCSNSWPHKKYKKDRIHQLSWVAYHGVHHKDLLVLHRCTTKSCCNPAHLYLGTHKDNRRDAFKDGTARIPDNRGSNCGTSKLTEDEVLQIRELGKYYDQPSLSSMFGVCRQHIGQILLRNVWRHI